MPVCEKHRSAPAVIYGGCVGCELESLRARIVALEAELDRTVESGRQVYASNLAATERVAELETGIRAYRSEHPLF